MLPITAPRHTKVLYALNESTAGVILWLLMFPAGIYWAGWTLGWLFNDGGEGFDQWNFDPNWLILGITCLVILVVGLWSESVKINSTIASKDNIFGITKNYNLLNKDNKIIARPAVLRHYELNNLVLVAESWDDRKQIGILMTERERAVSNLLSTQRSASISINADTSDLDVINARIEGHKELDTLALK